MKLLGQSNSINVRKVLWTCAELRIDVEREDWSKDPHKPHLPEFLKLNPKGLVPVLVDDDFVLTESNAICRYLVNTERSGLLPQTPRAQAEVDAWMDWQATELNTAWRAVFMGRVRMHEDYSDVKLQEKSVQAWNKQMAILDEHLRQNRSFVCGDKLSLADIVLALSTNRWEMTPMERPDLRNVSNWMQRLSDRRGFLAYCRNGVP